MHGKDAVVISLKESSLLTCLSIAMELRAWVYPLVYEPIMSQDSLPILLGAVDEGGVFCPNPEVPTAEKAEPNIQSQLDSATQAVKQRIDSYGMTLDKQSMNGRDVIIAGDVITSQLPIAVALQLLSGVKPKSLSIVIGNATPEVTEQVRVSGDLTTVLDVLTGVVSDDSHYFEHPDTYTPEQKHMLTEHIAAYWQ